MAEKFKLPRARNLSPRQAARRKRAYLSAFFTVPGCTITDALALEDVTPDSADETASRRA